MPSPSLFGSVSVGKDTTGNFRLSPYGLAVRSGVDGRFIARHHGELVDVSDFTLDGTENLVYRVPKRRPIPGKDIIVLSDNPFSVLFVEHLSDNGTVKGSDLNGNIQEIRPVANLLTQALTKRSGSLHFYVAIVGPESLLQKDDGHDLLPLLLLSGQAPGAGTGDPLSTLMLLRTLRQHDVDDSDLALLALLNSSGSGGSSEQLSLLLALQSSDLFSRDKSGEEEEEEKSADEKVNSRRRQEEQ